MKFRMQDSIFPDDQMVFRGSVKKLETDEAGCAWVELDVNVTVQDRVCTSCEVRVAVPAGADDNPWSRKGSDWRP